MIKLLNKEMNKMAIHTHVIFRPRNAMFEKKNLEQGIDYHISRARLRKIS